MQEESDLYQETQIQVPKVLHLHGIKGLSRVGVKFQGWFRVGLGSVEGRFRVCLGFI